jgi:phosphatidylserine/phosphatidylglycerophosphate/cardiolipin synthase-like enzyme
MIKELVKEIEIYPNDSLDLDKALVKLNEISNLANSIIKESKINESDISRLYGEIASSYLIAAKKVKPEHKFCLAFSSNYWRMLEIQTSPLASVEGLTYANDETNKNRLKESDIIRKLLPEIMEAKKSIKIACGEGGFLQRNPDLVNSLSESCNKGVDVSIYYLDLQDKKIVQKLAKNGCRMIKGADYSKLHYMIIDDFAYTHTHERYNDHFSYNDGRRIGLLKLDFKDLSCNRRGYEQSISFEEQEGIVYSDKNIISLLIDEINSAKKDIFIACGLGILLEKNKDLSDAVIHACKRGVKTHLYHVSMSGKIAEQLMQNGCIVLKGTLYPRLHYWIIDNFVYESTHPRQDDQFFSNDARRLRELENHFNLLSQSAS